jgi:transcriptional regulator with XRE-family HTH domain
MRGSVLTVLRKDLGWSQERLANELGVERDVVSDLERSPNITPLIEAVLATLRKTLADMRATPAVRLGP